MATKDEVVSAITHIMNNLHSDKWRGNLNNFDFQQLKAIYEDDTPGSTYVKDTLLGALRNQWPTLFDPKTGAEVTPPAAPAPPAPTAPAGSTGGEPNPTPANNQGQGNNPAGGNTPAGQGGSTEGSDELSGKAAETAKKLDSALAKNRTDLNEADVQLSDAILSATTSDEAGKTKLNALKQSIIDEVTRIGPDAMNTRAGMQEFATFLQGKTSDIMNVAHTAKLDSESQSKVMDAIGARLNALAQQNGTPGEPDDPDNPAPGEQPAAPGAPGDPGTLGAPGDPELPLDPLLNGGLPSDPFMQGLGGALGPALGALGSVPSALGSAIPSFGGGGGGGLSDLGPAIGSALRDAGANDPADKSDEDKPSELKDQLAGKPDEDKPGELEDQQTTPAGNNQQAGQPTEPGQPPVAGAAPPAPAPDLTVKVEGLGDIKVDNPALANASREVLAGGNVHDAFNRFNIPIPPPGTPVTDNAVSPGKTVFGDIGQYTDHQIMALGDNKAWVNGQVVPLDKVEQGTNFLGWMHPSTPTPATPVAVTSPPPVMQTPAAAPVAQAAAPAPAPATGLRDIFPGLSRPS
ncbi:hypothetical protein A5722_01390 [Mycobacterium vulneris]|uniref:DUF4226 domain-containing protein n=2 Tax=Mycolicibacterium TaxID=1866885 RepID=A0A7X6RZU2_9MYCO|nr:MULTISPECIES: DUF4226 domain-containing protein [Mycolicibacterium]MBX8687826.1 DUF4226 domain-containing protein [Mycobacterium sp. 20091114027_K0903767]OCB48647.1 hypothetical protein A5721_04660 [Mycolicibacterium vulneris]NKZ14991.1 DUF4226 domain-containing protein [Mycolicibacterium septicum DSM 44393]OBK58916.1 hypothetical protein A5654_32335 [Mycolicibacterium fortuitum]OCB51464.1 hypothetical protein A5722_01390 [Mycolicibacterium vulneris]